MESGSGQPLEFLPQVVAHSRGAAFVFQTLDLTNPGTFRDLSKPMGAQTEGRREKFIQRFKEVEKTEGTNLIISMVYPKSPPPIFLARKFRTKLEVA